MDEPKAYNGHTGHPPTSQPGEFVNTEASTLAIKREYDGEESDSSEHDGSGTFRERSGSSSKLRSRPIRSCTHCRQQKLRCDAAVNNPCTRCRKMGRKCIVDQFYRPYRGQVLCLRDELAYLRKQVKSLQRRESQLVTVIAKTSPDNPILTAPVDDFDSFAEPSSVSSNSIQPNGSTSDMSSKAAARDLLDFQNNARMPSLSQSPDYQYSGEHPSLPKLDAASTPGQSLPPLSAITPGRVETGPARSAISPGSFMSRGSVSSSATASEYIVGNVKLSRARAEELHRRFMTDYQPYAPILQSNSAAELHEQSHLLFWTVCLTASLSEPEPSLYYSLCDLIKQMAIEVCWLETPRSTYVVQALLILGIWPLPNEKVLDDCSYRFVGLAKDVGMQLGLHRGKFIYEFSRSQTRLPDAEKWRTRTWIFIFFAEQVWSASLGLPPNSPVDYLIENATSDESFPKSLRSLLILSIFYSKLATLMGSSISAPDGLLDGANRCTALYFLEQELERIGRTLGVEEDPAVEIYFLYVKLMICIFSFLPGTTIEDQAKYVVTAFQAGTRIITLMSSLVEQRRLIEYPIYMRQAMSFSALTLFRLHLSPLFQPRYVESARQSVVTVHRLYRNMLTAWKDLENDISRTAKVLEKLNFVIITHPYLLTQAPGIITRMRSHLTASLFYELIWAVHEARRRGAPSGAQSKSATHGVATPTSPIPEGTLPQPLIGPNPPQSSQVDSSVQPLPFYNQITKDDFTTTTTTTPNGTTITTLVPTHPNASLGVFATGTIPSQLAPNIQQPLQSNTFETDPLAPGLRETEVSYGAAAGSQGAVSFLGSTVAPNDPLHLQTLMQGIDWMNDKGDDFLGWMDMTASPF